LQKDQLSAMSFQTSLQMADCNVIIDKLLCICIQQSYANIQGGPRKVKPTTTLLVTFECVGIIRWFLADVNCIQQEVQDHPNGIIYQV